MKIFRYVCLKIDPFPPLKKKVHIGIFYESLCPDSIRFIKYQLQPMYAEFEEFVDIDFVPFGKSRVSFIVLNKRDCWHTTFSFACITDTLNNLLYLLICCASWSLFFLSIQSITKGNLIDFTCQHGDEECSGNKIHSCGLQLTQSQAQQVAFVTCQMSYGTDGSELVSFFFCARLEFLSFSWDARVFWGIFEFFSRFATFIGDVFSWFPNDLVLWTKRRFIINGVDFFQCAEQAQLPHDELLKCFLSDVATRLQLEAEEKTKQLASPRPLLAFVPTIVYNHVNTCKFFLVFYAKNQQQNTQMKMCWHSVSINFHEINWKVIVAVPHIG